MLKEIQIENFRCFKDRVRIPLAPLTLIYGRNLGGKTTILKALNLLKTTFSGGKGETPDLIVPTLDSAPFDLGGIENLANWRISDQSIKFRLVGTSNLCKDEVHQERRIRHIYEDIEPTGIEIEFKKDSYAGSARYVLHKIDFLNIYGNLLLSLTREQSVQINITTKFSINHLPDDKYWESSFELLQECNRNRDIKDFQKKVSLDIEGPLEHIGQDNKKCTLRLLAKETTLGDYIDASKTWIRYQSFKSKNNPSLMDFQDWSFARLGRRGDREFRAHQRIISESMRDLIGDDFPYIANLQSFVRHALDCVRSPLVNLETIVSNKKPAQRWIDLEKQTNVQVGPRGENVARIIQDTEIIEEINLACEYMDLGFQYKVKKIDGVSSRLCEILAVYDNGLEVNIADEGFAASQLLPTLAQLAKSKAQSKMNNPLGPYTNIVALEEPELHLYPELQFKFASYLINTVDHRNQRLLDTHSEMSTYAILDRVRRSSRGDLKENETKLNPSDVSFISVQKDKEEGSSIPHHIEADSFGNFSEPWPGGFFSERIERMI